MSADNGYVIQLNDQDKYVLQMYFASADAYPAPASAKPEQTFESFGEAVEAYRKMEVESDYYLSEYGLTFNLPDDHLQRTTKS